MSVAKMLISNAGIVVADGNAHFSRTGGLSYVMMKLQRTLGLFDATTPDTIYTFDDEMALMPEAVDYVLLHELGHLLSHKAGYEFHAKANKLRADKRLVLNPQERLEMAHLGDLEECIADCFAMGTLMSLGLNADLPLLIVRMDGYVRRHGEAVVQDLNKLAYGLVPLFNDMIEKRRARNAA